MPLALSTGWIVAAAAAALIAVVVLVSLQARRRRGTAWRELAVRHGLTYAEVRDRDGVRQPRVEGVLEQRPFRMRAVARGSDTDVLGATELVLEVGLRGPLPERLLVRKGGLAVDELRRRVEREAGHEAVREAAREAQHGTAAEAASDTAATQDGTPPRVDLHDAELARELTVVALEPEQARAWLDARRRRALLRLVRMPHAHGAGIRDGTLFVEERRLATPVPELEGHLRELMAIARELDAQPAAKARVGA